MREIIISELTQALQELARGFAHYLPRLIVMLIIALIGWVIAYLLKVLVRSVLRLTRFSKLSESAGATQLLNQAALPSSTELLSRFVFWVAWVGFILLGVNVLGIVGLQEYISSLFRIGSGQLLLSCGTTGSGQCELSVVAAVEHFAPDHHQQFCAIHGVRGVGHCGRDDATRFRDCVWSGNARLGDCVRHWRQGLGAGVPGEKTCHEENGGKGG